MWLACLAAVLATGVSGGVASAAIDGVTGGHFTAGDGASVQFFEHGPADAPTLVISPAFTGSARSYARRFGERLPDYHVVAIQLRGHGRGGGCDWGDLDWCSDQQAPDDGRYYGMRIARLAEDVREAAHFLCLDRFVLAGHSLGGNVLYSYVSQFGTRRLNGLFIYDQSPKNLEPGTAADATFPTEYASYPMDAFLDMVAELPEWTDEDGYVNVEAGVTQMLGGVDGQPSVLDPDDPQASFVMTIDAWNRWTDFSYRLNGKMLSLLFWNTLVSTYTDVMTTIRESGVPVLIYGGKVSIVHWEVMQWVHEEIPGSTFMLFDESVGVHAAHLNPEPSRSVFYDGVRTFLDGLSPCAADISGDGLVGADDLLAVVGCWNESGGACKTADCDGDGTIGVADVMVILARWGPCGP